MARRRNEADGVESKNPTSEIIDSPEAAEAAYVAAHEASVKRLTMPNQPHFDEIPGYQPDWFLEACRTEEQKAEPTSPSYLQSVAVLSAMREGDLGPLAAMIKASPEIPALIRREIVFMIEGDSEQSRGNRLFVKSHPDVDARKGGRHKLMNQHFRDQSIAAFLASKGGFSGQLEAALVEAEDFWEIKRSQLIKIWVKHKDEIQRMGLGRG